MADKPIQKSKPLRDSWVQMDALCCGAGWDENDLKNPQFLVEDVVGDSHPGSVCNRPDCIGHGHVIQAERNGFLTFSRYENVYALFARDHVHDVSKVRVLHRHADSVVDVLCVRSDAQHQSRQN